MILFQRLILIVQRELDMLPYFSFELTRIPTSLFKTGMMRKADKWKLRDLPTKHISFSEPPDDANILDGGALLHKVKWIPNTTYREIINQYTEYVFRKYGRSCIVFDGPLIKDHEHLRRTTGKTSANINIQLGMVANCQQKAFCNNDKNKSQFISLLSKALRHHDHDAGKVKVMQIH